MKSLNDIKNRMQQFNVTPSAEMRQNVLGKALTIQCRRKRQRLSGIEIWRRIMHSQSTKIAAAFLVIFTVLFGYNFFQGSNGSVFADVIEKLAATQTAQFDLTIEFGEQLPQTSTFYYQAPNQIRQEMANGTVNIVDYTDRKVLSLDPETMTALLRDVRQQDFHTALYEIFNHFQDMVTEAINLNDCDVLSLGTATIHNRPAYGYQLETVGQKPGLFWQGKGTLTIWADVKADFPLEIQWYSTMTNIRATVSNIALNTPLDPALFSQDVPEGYHLATPVERDVPAVAPSDTSSPQSEISETETIGGSDLNLAELLEGLGKQDQTLIRFFHSWTVLSMGRFPSSLTTDAVKDLDPDGNLGFKQEGWSYTISFSLPNLLNGAFPKDYANSLSQDDIEQINRKEGPAYEAFQAMLEEKAKYIKPHFAAIFAGFELIYSLPPSAEWHYNGTGVMLGDTDTAVFRYKPDGSDTYRVIYGDLSMEDVRPEDLPSDETPSLVEIDKETADALETAIQLGADIPADKRAIVLRMLTLKEKDLIKGLATYLEFSGGSYPPTLDASREFMIHLNELANPAYETQKIDKKQFEAKVLDIGFGTFFYDELTRKKKDPAYYGSGLMVNDSDKVLVRWKLSKDRYRVVFGNLTAKTVSADELAELENHTNPEQ